MNDTNPFASFEHQENEHPKKKFHLLEIIFSVLFVLGFILFLSRIPGASITIIVSLGLLSSLYFCFSFAVLNGIPLRKIFKKESFHGIKTLRIIGTVLTGICISGIIMGILFRVMSWPGSLVMLLFNGIGLVIIAVTLILKQLKNKSKLNTLVLSRAAIFCILALLLFFTPTYTFDALRFGKEHPEYIEALKTLDKDKENPELQKKVDEEWSKIRRRDGSK